MFREVYTQPFSYIRQSPIGGIEKHVRSYIILWSYPLAFENTPKCLRNIQLRRIWRQKKKRKSLVGIASKIMAYWYHGRVHECNASTSAESLKVKEEHKRKEHAAFKFHKSVV